MKKIKVIEAIIDAKMPDFIPKYMQIIYPNLDFQSQSESYKKLIITTIKNCLFCLFITNDLESIKELDLVDLHIMAKKVHNISLFKNSQDFDRETELYKKNSFELVMLAHSELSPLIRDALIKKGTCI
jgi:hypothetical protein